MKGNSGNSGTTDDGRGTSFFGIRPSSPVLRPSCLRARWRASFCSAAAVAFSRRHRSRHRRRRRARQGRKPRPRPDAAGLRGRGRRARPADHRVPVGGAAAAVGDGAIGTACARAPHLVQLDHRRPHPGTGVRARLRRHQPDPRAGGRGQEGLAEIRRDGDHRRGFGLDHHDERRRMVSRAHRGRSPETAGARRSRAGEIHRGHVGRTHDRFRGDAHHGLSGHDRCRARAAALCQLSCERDAAGDHARRRRRHAAYRRVARQRGRGRAVHRKSRLRRLLANRRPQPHDARDPRAGAEGARGHARPQVGDPALQGVHSRSRNRYLQGSIAGGAARQRRDLLRRCPRAGRDDIELHGIGRESD